MIVLVVLALCLHSVECALCPASSVLSSTAYSGYPLDLFDVEALSSASSLFDCSSHVNATYKAPHRCSETYKPCPVKEEHIQHVVGNEGVGMDNCRFYNNLMKTDKKMRLIAYGGSVTVGHGTQGGVRGNWDDEQPWLTYLGEWFNSSHPNRMKRYNLGFSAHNSYRMLDIVYEFSKKHGITTYNSSDLIFLDFAKNDNICSNPAEQYQLKVGVETMVRKILFRSDPADPPTIVLLDGTASNVDLGFCAFQYIEVYKNISRYYSIPFWSYRDAVTLVNYTSVNEKAYESEVKWTNVYYTGGHPPWYVHMFAADLYANALQKQFQMCATAPAPSRSAVSTSVLKIPPQLHTDVKMRCDAEWKPLLSIDYDDLHDGIFHNVIGTFESVPEGTWLLRSDTKDKGGFIRELNFTNAENPVANNEPHAKLVFTPNMANVNFSGLAKWNRQLELKVKYLRTYNNAGYADVFLCGQRVMFRLSHNRLTGLDALWQDYKDFKFSLPTVMLAPINLRDYCTNPDVVPTLEILHRDATNINDVSIPPQTTQDEESKVPYVSDPIVRGRQKVKIISVSLCVAAHRWS